MFSVQVALGWNYLAFEIVIGGGAVRSLSSLYVVAETTRDLVKFGNESVGHNGPSF